MANKTKNASLKHLTCFVPTVSTCIASTDFSAKIHAGKCRKELLAMKLMEILPY